MGAAAAEEGSRGWGPPILREGKGPGAVAPQQREAPAALPLTCHPVPQPRVSVPLSVLDPPHQYRIHRRKSFDASDTLALPRVSSYMGPGWGRTWGCPRVAQVPRSILRPREGQGLSQGYTVRLGSRRARLWSSAWVTAITMLCLLPEGGGAPRWPRGFQDKCCPHVGTTRMGPGH